MIRVHSTWASGASAMAVPGWPELAACGRVHGQAPDDVDGPLLEVGVGHGPPRRLVTPERHGERSAWSTVDGEPLARVTRPSGRRADRVRRREQGDGGGEAVEEVAAADRAELAGAEHAGDGAAPTTSVDDLGVVVGLAEQAEPRPLQVNTSAPAAGAPASSARRSSSAESASRTWNCTVVADLDLVADGDGADVAVGRRARCGRGSRRGRSRPCARRSRGRGAGPAGAAGARSSVEAARASSCRRSSAGRPAELVDDVALGLGHRERVADRAGSPATRRS